MPIPRSLISLSNRSAFRFFSQVYKKDGKLLMKDSSPSAHEKKCAELYAAAQKDPMKHIDGTVAVLEEQLCRAQNRLDIFREEGEQDRDETLHKRKDGKYVIPGSSLWKKHSEAQNNFYAAQSSITGKFLFNCTTLRNKWKEEANIAANTYQQAIDNGHDCEGTLYEDVEGQENTPKF